jgi:hypothetical protein
LVVQRVAAELTAQQRAPEPDARERNHHLVLELPPVLSAHRLVVVGEPREAAADEGSEQQGAAVKSCEIGSSCSYRTLLGYLVVTRDLQIPGAPSMAVRLIPTARALSGDTSPIVLRPRVDGAGSSWTGLDIAANF